MPPKGGAKAGKAQDKAKATAKAKLVEDKTFGLKNKNKSSKVQKYVQQVTASSKPQQQQQGPSKERKKAEEAAKELAALFAMAIKQPKVPPGVDPKSIVCEYYRAGQCTKGSKCKFSHDLSVERKGEKLDLYSDKRDGEKEDKEGGMEDWDQEQLEKAIAEKHGVENKNRATDIVCRYFLDAVEKQQYGWFWVCPNGKDCKYRHALPPGYVLKSQMKQLLEEEAANSKSVEEIIEEERAKVDAKTPITDTVFKQWKASQDEARQKKAEEALDERRRRGVMTGREIFAQEGFVAADDAAASASDAYAREEDVEEQIKQMHTETVAAHAAASAKADIDGPAEHAELPGAGAPSAASAKPADSAPKVSLTQQEEEELFAEGSSDDGDDDDLLDELADDLSKVVST